MELARYQLPTVPDPINGKDIANKDYVDSGGGGGASLIVGNAFRVDAAGAIVHLFPAGIQTTATAGGITEMQFPVGKAGTISKLSWVALANSTTANSTFEIYKNAVATGVKVVIAAGVIALQQDLINSIAVVAGDMISVQMIVGSGGSMVKYSWSFEIA